MQGTTELNWFSVDKLLLFRGIHITESCLGSAVVQYRASGSCRRSTPKTPTSVSLNNWTTGETMTYRLPQTCRLPAGQLQYSPTYAPIPAPGINIKVPYVANAWPRSIGWFVILRHGKRAPCRLLRVVCYVHPQPEYYCTMLKQIKRTTF